MMHGAYSAKHFNIVIHHPQALFEILWQSIAASFRSFSKTSKNDCFFMSVCPPASKEQFGSHWTDFREI
jgi:hypothetical protein